MTVLTGVTKRGECYYVKGKHNGQRASFTVHAKDVESMTSRQDFEAFCIRNLPDCVESKRYEVAV